MTHLWRGVADELRMRVARADHGPNGELPTEARLGDEFGVSRITIRRALEALRDEGILVAGRGRGWRVAGIDAGRPVGFFAVTDTGRGRDAGLHYEIVSWSSAPAAETVFAKAGDGPLLRIERLGTVAGCPVDRSLLLICGRYAAQVSPAQIASTTPARLLATMGCVFGATDQSVRASLATADDASLGLEPGDPILIVQRLVHNAGGEPVLETEHRHPGDLVQVDLTFPTTDTTERPPVRFVSLPVT